MWAIAAIIALGVVIELSWRWRERAVRRIRAEHEERQP